MAIEWFNSTQKAKTCLLTICDTNITLNKHACDLVPNVFSVMLGLDYTNKYLYIRALNKDLAERGSVPKENQYSITIRSSYGRISNVDFIKEIKKVLGIESLVEPKKFVVSLENNDILKANLGKEVN